MFRHREIRDLLNTTNKTLLELYNDPFTGWPYLLLFGLRYQDNRLTLDNCSDFIDQWAEKHKDDEAPLKGLGDLLIEGLTASGLLRLEAEGAREGNATPVTETPSAP